jgi:uncharacterized membrane protein
MAAAAWAARPDLARTILGLGLLSGVLLAGCTALVGVATTAAIGVAASVAAAVGYGVRLDLTARWSLEG